MDVIRCPVSAGLNFRRTKLSRMAVEPRKPRKFSTAKIKVHTVCERSHVTNMAGCPCTDKEQFQYLYTFPTADGIDDGLVELVLGEFELPTVFIHLIAVDLELASSA